MSPGVCWLVGETLMAMPPIQQSLEPKWCTCNLAREREKRLRELPDFAKCKGFFS